MIRLSAVNTNQPYTNKADAYARYRWDYAPEAIQTIIKIAGLTQRCSAADLGAGTGILTRHLCAVVGKLWAVEPEAAMRPHLGAALAEYPNAIVVAAGAEDTGIPSGSLDLVTAAQAVHWFDPEPARREIARILKPTGWLALLRNSPTDAEQNKALREICTPQNGASDAEAPGAQTPSEFYFGHQNYLKYSFPFAYTQNWEQFIGSLQSAAFTPEAGSPLYERFEQAARQVFDRFSRGGLLEGHGATELLLGQVTNPWPGDDG